ncbi:MarR family transcriptional regulator [Breoghania sp. JC706]|uniref:MarR family winged helix-turn-helix transcriptional regulator n=1 Tax=Breoghania sp. JC706 TaxID=3117732 RepID=UPI0030092E9D
MSPEAPAGETRGVPDNADVSNAAVSKERLRLWLRILKVSRFVEAELRERLRVEFDSTLPRFDVLAALYRNDKGLRMSELSGVLRVSNGNVTGIVDRLVKDGLIVRVPVEGDRRAMIVRLTNRGRESFAELAAVHEAWVDELLGAIDPDEADHLVTLFGAIADRFEDNKTSDVQGG